MYHNDVYISNSNSEESTPESENNVIFNVTRSPTGYHSFIAAVINAIKNSTTTSKNKEQIKNPISISHENTDGIEMLESETEPCLMMENVLEDVPMTDSHTQNLISSCNLSYTQSLEQDSLHNLCEAIANRRKIEEQTKMMNQTTQNDKFNSVGESVTTSSYCEQEIPVEILVNNVINVDNLVTKLLKILRIIQMENDTCIQQLIDEK